MATITEAMLRELLKGNIGPFLRAINVESSITLIGDTESKELLQELVSEQRRMRLALELIVDQRVEDEGE